MFNGRVPEKVIAENSGHTCRSTKVLQCYEKTSEKLQQAITKVINNSGVGRYFTMGGTNQVLIIHVQY